ncbi:hypothetical protein K457DRAFT_123819 [Linnemannia elongata AG-77]|uniref:Uncharacterized protein n=1 Tax=Linnemannia elongata AG-77 TaxID=1314771 RepID=A0A197K394_9FUNG|nr:hypothetical protein K457DRAFT_123819 [Linnemannia elongata AG-77]
MADIQTQVVEETQEIIVVSEDATATNTSTITATIITDDEPALTPEVTEPAPIAPAPTPVVAPTSVVVTEAKQQSRLSLAFMKISGGCGLCFSPLKSGPTDYHNLVETPTDEDEPNHLPDSHDNNGNAAVPVVITDDYKGEHQVEGEIVVASSSTDSHGYLHHREEEVHEEIKSRDLAVVEEFTTVMEEHNIVVQEDQRQQEMQEVQFSTQIIDAPSTFVEEIVEDVVVDDSSLPITAAVVAEAIPSLGKPVAAPAPEAVSIPVSPAPTRSKTFKFTKRSTSASPATSSSTSSSPSSPSSTSPLRERLGRFAKIIRPSETNSSIHSKVESLKVSTTPASPSVEDAVVATAITAEPEQIVEKKTVVPLTPISPVLKELSVPSLRSDAATPQPQQHNNNNHRNSLVVDTLVSNNTTTTTTHTSTTTTSAPVAIPSSWSNSPTTLHQHESSTGQSISRTGRASTMDSATEVGSLSSNSNSNSNEQLSSIATSAPTGKDGLKANRRKSVMKKLGKIINTMNTNSRKNSMDKERDSATPTKNEKRMSRQGSLTLTSPLESEENLGL